MSSTRSRRDSKKDGDPDEQDPAALARAQRIAAFDRSIRQWKERRRRPPPKSARQIKFRCSLNNTILDVFKAKGYKETNSETEWDIYWAPRDWIRGVYDRVRLDAHQRVNHFRNYYELTRKDLMLKNLKRAKRQLVKEGRHEEAAQWNFFPETFNLPSEYLLFVDTFKKNPQLQWIMKPVGKCQGKGIFLFSKLSQISDWKNDNRWGPDDKQSEKYVCQQYIEKPFLVGGKKFDLRLYVLVTSYYPLTVYMYREGFARFTTVRYSMNKNNLESDYIHLTNVAVQKKAPGYDGDSGGKWSVRRLKLYMAQRFGNDRVNRLFCEIQLVVLRSLMSVQKVMINDKNSFALYGYDVLIDEALKVWLIEINACPSLTANTPADYKMKFSMLSDAISIVNLDGRLTGMEEQIGGFDLIYRNGFVKFDSNCIYTTFLGCANDRGRQLRSLAKSFAKRKAHEQKQKDKEKEAAASKRSGGSRGGGSGGSGSRGSGSSGSRGSGSSGRGSGSDARDSRTSSTSNSRSASDSRYSGSDSTRNRAATG